MHKAITALLNADREEQGGTVKSRLPSVIRAKSRTTLSGREISTIRSEPPRINVVTTREKVNH